jgi:hypothetical protein
MEIKMIDHEDIIAWALQAGVHNAHTELTLMAGLERFAKLAYAAGAKDAQEFCIRIYRNASALADDAIRNREQYE